MLMVRSITNEIIKNMIKLISNYHYGGSLWFYASKEVGYIEFTIGKDSLYIYVKVFLKKSYIYVRFLLT